MKSHKRFAESNGAVWSEEIKKGGGVVVKKLIKGAGKGWRIAVSSGEKCVCRARSNGAIKSGGGRGKRDKVAEHTFPLCLGKCRDRT